MKTVSEWNKKCGVFDAININDKCIRYSLITVPSAPPDNVQAGMLNLTAGWVRWSPPPPQHHNGHLLGYKIQVRLIFQKIIKLKRVRGEVGVSRIFNEAFPFQVKAGNMSKILAQMTLNATTMSVMLNNLTTGATYNIRVVAYTRIGAGPFSQPVSFIRLPIRLEYMI